MGQICAVLHLAPRPLNAGAVMDAPGVSRSNVPMDLRELRGWNLVVPRQIPDDRRDHFTTPEDVSQILRVPAEERRKREVAPTLPVLRELPLQTAACPDDRHAQARVAVLRAGGERTGIAQSL